MPSSPALHQIRCRYQPVSEDDLIEYGHDQHVSNECARALRHHQSSPPLVVANLPPHHQVLDVLTLLESKERES